MGTGASAAGLSLRWRLFPSLPQSHAPVPPALPAGRLAPSSRLSVWHGWESPHAPFCLSAPAPAPASLLIPAPVPTPAPVLAPCRPGPQGWAPPPPPPWACQFSKLVSRFTLLPPRGPAESLLFLRRPAFNPCAILGAVRRNLSSFGEFWFFYLPSYGELIADSRPTSGHHPPVPPVVSATSRACSPQPWPRWAPPAGPLAQLHH